MIRDETVVMKLPVHIRDLAQVAEQLSSQYECIPLIEVRRSFLGPQNELRRADELSFFNRSLC